MTANLNGLLDRIGITVSGLCGVHCALVPLVFLMMPSLQAALYSFRNPHHDFAQWLVSIGRWEGWVVGVAIAIAGLSMALLYRRHCRIEPPLLAGCSASLLVAAVWGPGAHSLLLHTALAVAGGAAMCSAHLLSLRLAMRPNSSTHAGGETCPQPITRSST